MKERRKRLLWSMFKKEIKTGKDNTDEFEKEYERKEQ